MASLLKQASIHVQSAASTAVNAVTGLKPPEQNQTSAPMGSNVPVQLPLFALTSSMNKLGQQIKGPSNDNTLMKQILATHVPHGPDVDVRPLLTVVKDILHCATLNVAVAQERNTEAMEETTYHLNISAMIEALAFPIHKVGSQMCCKCTTGGGDTHATTLAVLSTLGSYSWDAKLVLSLSAFAVSYGSYCLAAQLHTINPLAKSVALLMQLPHILEHTESLKHHFDAINDLIVAVIDVTESIITLTELPSQYISANTPLSDAINHVPTAVYWTITSIVACISQITGLTCNGLEYLNSTTESLELSSLAHKVKSIHGHLTKLLAECHICIEDKKQNEEFQSLIRLFEKTHIDNVKVLKELIFSRDDLALVDNKGEKFGIDVLRRKNVFLFISDLDVAHREIKVLTKIYNNTVTKYRKENPYKVVWLPVIDNLVEWSSDAKKDTFEERRRLMPWLSLHSPSLLKPVVIRYIKEIWHFEKQPLFVVLDGKGRVSPDASHMVWIWGAFTAVDLWKDVTWKLEFLFDNIDSRIANWVEEKKFICMYGGEDLDWIKKFISRMNSVAQEAQIPLEMIYVGKHYHSEDRTRKIKEKIKNEKLSTSFLDVEMTWFFWMRLESLWYSKIENDTIKQEVTALLSFYGGDNGWAVICDGSTRMVKDNGKIIMDCLKKFETWKERVKTDGFISAMSNALAQLHTGEHCTHLILSSTNGSIIPEHVACTVCKSPMEKYALYKCCKD